LAFEFGSRLAVLGYSAFSDCSSLRTIDIPRSVEMISAHCFLLCTSLSAVTFEAGSQLWCLEELAFLGCSSLRSICLPRSLERVSSECFRLCDELTDVFVEAGSKLSGESISNLPAQWKVALQ
jgi:hypothetical protein